MLLDSVAPYLLIGQALARPANFINQELYGPPTTLPWGIPIAANNRIPPYNDLIQYPDTTRFHPTFAYEMIWNFAAAGLLIWLSRKFEAKMRPGVVFFGWLILAGIGRAIIETFRPDQPHFAGIALSYSRLIAILMALAGTILILGRYYIIPLPFWKKPAPANQ
jgi:phosphatidylglycerol:prolipoprotein diacylglycerol transferase